MNKKLDLKNTRIYSNTVSDISYAFTHLGEEVYLSDDKDFNTFTKGKLIGVRYMSDCAYSTYTKYPFVGSSVEDGGLVISKYFIPTKDAKFKEKELRPFKSVQEFIEETECEIGDVITFKRKDLDTEYTMIFNGYALVKGDVLVVYLGTVCYTLEELMDYLYYKGGEWYPFGIIE